MDHDCELKVTFFPPLYLQRRIWVLDILRQEGVTSILDVGCGEGELLNCLCQPAAWLSPHPDHTNISAKDEIINLHPTRVAGLDISADTLIFASRGISPSFQGITRWEPVEAKIWKGSLDSLNEEFVDIECIVAMEVIEHLTQDIFSEFAPVLLGVYHPRLLLLTTPSYTFNARFTAPDAPASARTGYPDPTGRTSRIFRHHDHKFEWTVEEFQEWCSATAEEWGYCVEISTVGKASEQDEWGRDDELGGATQVAAFKRLEDKSIVEKRVERSKEVAERSSMRPKQELLATRLHEAHPCSQKPVSLQEIGESVKLRMETERESFMRLEELWYEQDIAIMCGGWIELLVKAVDEHDKLALHKDERERKTNWRVELTGGVENPRNFWPPEDENESGLDYTPPDYFPEEVPSLLSWETESSGADGDISADNSEEEEEEDGEEFWGAKANFALEHNVAGWEMYPLGVDATRTDRDSTGDDTGSRERSKREIRHTKGKSRRDISEKGSSAGHSTDVES